MSDFKEHKRRRQEVPMFHWTAQLCYYQTPFRLSGSVALQANKNWRGSEMESKLHFPVKRDP